MDKVTEMHFYPDGDVEVVGLMYVKEVVRLVEYRRMTSEEALRPEEKEFLESYMNR